MLTHACCIECTPQVRGKQAAKQAKTNLKNSGKQIYKGAPAADTCGLGPAAFLSHAVWSASMCLHWPAALCGRSCKIGAFCDHLRAYCCCVCAGVRSGDLEEPVANNSTIYSINAVVLATAAGIAAYNPGLVSSQNCVAYLHLVPALLTARQTVPHRALSPT
jgi:hypothetical protein